MKILGFNISRTKKSDGSGFMPICMDMFGRFNPYAERNYFTTYKTIAEVQYPVRYITDRVVKADILLKKFKDDSVVWDNKAVNEMLAKPNPYYSFKDMMREFVTMKLITGNAYILANVMHGVENALYKYCDNFYVLPSQNTDILCGGAFLSDEYIKEYRTTMFGRVYSFPKNVVFHERDGWDYSDTNLKGFSRLEAMKYPLANLLAVYEARNVIYTKRGALGAIIGNKQDNDGINPLTSDEREEVLRQLQDGYGLSRNKSQFIVSRIPLSYVKFGNTISELEPFEETLQDAIQIAGAFGVNKELLPRKDNSTFSNLHSAEVDCYSNVIMPITKEFLSNFGKWVGLERDGLYLDADFSHVEVLSENSKNVVDEKRAISDKCKIEFQMGVITLNDWRAQIGMETMPDKVYDKTIFQMTEQELNYIQNILK